MFWVSRTHRVGCPSFVTLRASKDGQQLVVVNLNTEHNHPVSKEDFQVLPKQRRLNPEELQALEPILHSTMDRKVLKEHIHQTIGKMLTLRDVSNQLGRSNPNLQHVFTKMEPSDHSITVIADPKMDCSQFVDYEESPQNICEHGKLDYGSIEPNSRIGKRPSVGAIKKKPPPKKMKKATTSDLLQVLKNQKETNETLGHIRDSLRGIDRSLTTLVEALTK